MLSNKRKSRELVIINLELELIPFPGSTSEHHKPLEFHISRLCHQQKSSVELWVRNSLLSVFILCITVARILFAQNTYSCSYYPWILVCMQKSASLFFYSRVWDLSQWRNNKSNCISNFLLCQISPVQK